MKLGSINPVRPVLLVIAAAVSAFLSVPTLADEPFANAISRSRYLMGTSCEIVVRGDIDVSDRAFDEIARVERLISTWVDRSELATLNFTCNEAVTIEIYTT